jgi:hypothetical protein
VNAVSPPGLVALVGIDFGFVAAPRSSVSVGDHWVLIEAVEIAGMAGSYGFKMEAPGHSDHLRTGVTALFRAHRVTASRWRGSFAAQFQRERTPARSDPAGWPGTDLLV